MNKTEQSDTIKKQTSVMSTKIFLYVTLAISVLLFFIVLTSNVFAQPVLPSAPDQAPIDGGLGLLAAAGGAYAIKKLKAKRESEMKE
ncbi:MAG: hypothetical protein RLN81_08615 [Balneolaceae bacterium]